MKTGDGELFVHLWEWNDDYFVLPEDEFRARVLEPQAIRESESPHAAEPQKPDCPLIGQASHGFAFGEPTPKRCACPEAG